MIKMIIFDWKRTLYDPDKKALIEGARELLNFLDRKNIHMVLIGKGGDDMQQEVDRLGIGEYFQKIVFTQGEKDPKTFIPFIFEQDPRDTLFIGDRVRSELEIGNKLGVTTIWVKQGKFAQEEPEKATQKPAFIVSNLPECLNLLLTFNN